MDLNLLFPTIEEAYFNLASHLEKGIGLPVEHTSKNLEATKEMFPEIAKRSILLYMRGYNVILDQLLKTYPQTIDVLWQVKRRGKRIILADGDVQACGLGHYPGDGPSDSYMARKLVEIYGSYGNTISLDEDPSNLLEVGSSHIIVDPILEARLFRTSNKTGKSVLSFWDYRENTPTRFCSESLGVS